MHDVLHREGSTPAEPNAPEVPSDAVRGQLERLLARPELAGSERLSTFLRYVVEETLEGRGDQIKGYNIAVSALGRGEGFDAQVDPVVRVHAHRLRQILDHYYLADGRDDEVVIKLRRGNYRPQLSRRSEADRDARAEAAPAAARGAKPSLAVLPFVSRSDDPASVAFCAGLADELSSSLTRFDHVDPVRGCSDLEAAIGVGAKFTLEASVWVSGERVRISTAVTDTRSRHQIWADRFTFAWRRDDPLAVADEVAATIANRVADEYGVLPRSLRAETLQRPVQTLIGYEAVLRFHRYNYTTTPEQAAADYLAALQSLKHAVRVDPDYALAWSMLAHLYIDAEAHGQPADDTPNPLAEALACARRAVDLDPVCQNARFALAYAELMNGNAGRAIEAARLTIRLNPGSTYCCGGAGWVMALAGAWDEGVAVVRQAIARAEQYPRWLHLVLFLDRFKVGDVDGTLVEARAYDTPAVPWDPIFHAVAHHGLGQAAEARIALARLIALRPDFRETGKAYMARKIRDPALLARLVASLADAGLALA